MHELFVAGNNVAILGAVSQQSVRCAGILFGVTFLKNTCMTSFERRFRVLDYHFFCSLSCITAGLYIVAPDLVVINRHPLFLIVVRVSTYHIASFAL
jgi:hypothetical protein